MRPAQIWLSLVKRIATVAECRTPGQADCSSHEATLFRIAQRQLFAGVVSGGRGTFECLRTRAVMTAGSAIQTRR